MKKNRVCPSTNWTTCASVKRVARLCQSLLENIFQPGNIFQPLSTTNHDSRKFPKVPSPRKTSARDLEHGAVAASPTRPRGRPSARRTRKIPFDCFIASASTSISRAPFRVRRAHPLTSSSGSFPRDRPSLNLHPRARASLVAPFLSRAFTRGE